MLKLHLKWRCDNLKEKWNPLSGDMEYKDLDIYSRVSIMHKLCHWRLELDDIGDLLRVSQFKWAILSGQGYNESDCIRRWSMGHPEWAEL